MKKALLTTICFTFAACGPSVPIDADKNLEERLDKIRSIETTETISAEEANTIRTLCLDLKAKKTLFRTFASQGTEIEFNGSKKTCANEDTNLIPNFTVGVEDRGNLLTFTSSDQAPFKNIVVDDRDEMADVCKHVEAAISRGQRPLRVIKTGAAPYWIYAFSEGDGRCLDTEVNCLYVESGIQSSGANYKIQDVNFYAVNADLQDRLRGVVTERSHASVCFSDNERTSITKMSFLRVIE
ncbi:MAG: hypothetical protein CME64_15820 [Halobacteriovoraceae bacterium]|nr:hypothetical protein [Halobacteriovoraceae bacterium]|tara:strand:+ start:11980 stop:12699 length:720 start_codon:yes stop_codon:yes gene_type:complete